jgi:hypothetical protein
MKQLVLALIVFCVFITGCSEKCVEHVYNSTVVVDVSDTVIINHFKQEASAVIERLTPESLKRCEGIKIDIEAIGATIENHGALIAFPASGVLNNNIGNYDLSDSNNAKKQTINKELLNALDGFKAIGNNQSQIFYTLTQILSNKNGKVLIYTDLLEYYGNVSFYKTGYDFDKMYEGILKQYAMDSSKIKFTGTISIVSPLGKNQDKVLYARKFFKYYFDRIGLSPSQYEFIGSISQSKL